MSPNLAIADAVVEPLEHVSSYHGLRDPGRVHFFSMQRIIGDELGKLKGSASDYVVELVDKPSTRRTVRS